MKPIRILLMLCWALGCANALQAGNTGAAEVHNLNVSPSCYTPGGTLTVSFSVRCDTWQSVFGSILISTNTTPGTADNAMWDANGQLSASNPDTGGENGGWMASENGTRNFISVTQVINVPASTTGNVYIIVAVKQNYEYQQPWGNAIDDNRNKQINQCAGITPSATFSPSFTPVPFSPTPSFTRTMTPGTPTPTPYGTPTFTPTPVRRWQGLPASERLYGLEYNPLPPQGSPVFNDLSVWYADVANTDVNNQSTRNTARYVVTLSNLAGQVAVETRIGPYGVTCTTGYWNSSNYLGATSLTLPPRPQNLSTTYAWVGVSVPYTEQFSAVGDARFTPYYDNLHGGAYPDGYNWFYKSVTTTTWEDYEAEMAPYFPKAVFDRYNGGPDIDTPKLFGLWRNAIYNSRGIFNSLSGYSNYYLGIGGEIGGDSANKLSLNGVNTLSGPYGASGTSRHEEIIGSTVLIRAGTTASPTWDSLPFLGELWPDSSYTSDWSSSGALAASTWGNLRNNQNSGVAFRDKQENVSQLGRYSFPQVTHRNQSPGCATFMNGTNSGGAGSFNHSSITNYDEAWLGDSVTMGNDYNFAMAPTFNVNRPWSIDGSGNTPPEWNDAIYNSASNRPVLDVFPTDAASNTNTGFYSWHSNLASSLRRSSAAIRGLLGGSAPYKVGWFVVSGLAPSTDSGINFVARFSVIGCLRTFFDAGAPAVSADGVFNGKPLNALGTLTNAVSGSSYRLEPIPYVQITAPTLGQKLDGYGTIGISWVERSVRWDGVRYTEKYPCADQADSAGNCPPADINNPGNPNLEWHSLTGTALAFNIIYSSDGGTTWFTAQSDTSCSPGVYQPGDSIPGNTTAGQYTYNYSWDVSALSAGSYKVRVEVFRTAYGLHYGYHEVIMKLNP